MRDLVYINKNADVIAQFLKVVPKIKNGNKKKYIELAKAITTFKLKDAMEVLVQLMASDA